MVPAVQRVFAIEELRDIIVDQLGTCRDSETSRYMLVTREWRKYFAAVLYANVCLEEEPVQSSRLLRTLITSPHIAILVDHLTVDRCLPVDRLVQLLASCTQAHTAAIMMPHCDQGYLNPSTPHTTSAVEALPPVTVPNPELPVSYALRELSVRVKMLKDGCDNLYFLLGQMKQLRILRLIHLTTPKYPER